MLVCTTEHLQNTIHHPRIKQGCIVITLQRKYQRVPVTCSIAVHLAVGVDIQVIKQIINR